MAYEIRKFSIIIVVAVLFSIFSFAFADAFVPEIEYPSNCVEADDNRYERSYTQPTARNCSQTPPPNQSTIDACPGQLNQDYRTCEYECHCNEITQQHQKKEDNIIFWIATALGSIAIVAGMLLPQKNPLNEWVGTGFVLGGVLTLFIATSIYWNNIDKILRPAVIALLIAVVLWIAYKRFMPDKQ